MESRYTAQTWYPDRGATRVKDGEGPLAFNLKERSSCLQRQFCGPARAFKIAMVPATPAFGEVAAIAGGGDAPPTSLRRLLQPGGGPVGAPGCDRDGPTVQVHPVLPVATGAVRVARLHGPLRHRHQPVHS